jgi:hypothetical protein
MPRPNLVVQSDTDSDEAARVTRTEVDTENGTTSNAEKSGDQLITEKLINRINEMADSIKVLNAVDQTLKIMVMVDINKRSKTTLTLVKMVIIIMVSRGSPQVGLLITKM